MREAVSDGGGGHGLKPEPLDGLLRARVLDDVAEDQFAFAPGVAGIDKLIDILSLDQFGQELESVLVPFDGLQIKVRRDDRQMRKGPPAFFVLELLRALQFEQMPYGR